MAEWILRRFNYWPQMDALRIKEMPKMIRINPEVLEACLRLLDDGDDYPGLKFSGNKESYERLKHDIDLVASTLAGLLTKATEKMRMKDARVN